MRDLVSTAKFLAMIRAGDYTSNMTDPLKTRCLSNFLY